MYLFIKLYICILKYRYLFIKLFIKLLLIITMSYSRLILMIYGLKLSF